MKVDFLVIIDNLSYLISNGRSIYIDRARVLVKEDFVADFVVALCGRGHDSTRRKSLGKPSLGLEM